MRQFFACTFVVLLNMLALCAAAQWQLKYQFSEEFNIFSQQQLLIDSVVVTDVSSEAESATSQEERIESAFTLTATIVPADCGKPGSVQAHVTGGTAPFTYQLRNFSFTSFANGYYTGVAPGTYLLVATDADGHTEMYPVIVPETRSVPTLTVSDFGLPGTCSSIDGWVEFTATGGAAPYEYSMDGINFQTSNRFENLSPGYYTFFTRDANGCIGTHRLNTDLLYPPGCRIPYGVSYSEYTCNGIGNITLVVQETQFDPYQYSLDGVNYGNSGTFTNLSTGLHIVYYRDIRGVVYTTAFSMTERCTPTITFGTNRSRCDGSTGRISVNVTGGYPPFQYSLDGVNFQTTNLFTGVASGYYNVVVRDSRNREHFGFVFVDNLCVVANITTTNQTCGNTNGSINVNVTQGAPPYTYSIDGVNFQAGSSFTGLAAGTYDVRIRDGNGRIETIKTIVSGGCLQVNPFALRSHCVADEGTVAALMPHGGTAPYSYSIDGINFQTGNTFFGLQPGLYTITVRDANNRIGIGAATVLEPDPLLIMDAVGWPAGCAGNDGRIKIFASGGRGALEYSLNGGTFTNNSDYTGLTPGLYSITVRDAGDCILTNSILVGSQCMSVTATPVNGTCGLSNASIQVAGTGGTAPYEFSINGSTFEAVTEFTGLAAGTYTITIRDALGATAQTTATVTSPAGPSLTVSMFAATCLGNDGQIEITPSAGTMPYSFSIDGINWQTSAVFTGLAPNNYQAVVQDANTCEATALIDVVLNNNIQLTMPSSVAICENGTAQITVQSNASGYSWSPQTGVNNPLISEPEFSPDQTTLYTLTASLGVCTTENTLNVVVHPAPVPNAGNDIKICYGDDVQLQGSGGVSYQWAPSQGMQSAETATPLIRNLTESTTYSLSVVDNNGCPSVSPDEVRVTVTPEAVVFAGDDVTVQMNQPHQLNAVDVNGSGFTEYLWSPASGLSNSTIQSPVARLVATQRYTVTARTPQGCTASDEIYLNVYSKSELYVPTAFSPNDDGLNDRLYVIPVGLTTLTRFSIFNRQGQQMFTTTNSQLGWDGRWKGKLQNAGVFVWVAEGIDDQGNKIIRKGTVTLVL